MKHFNINERDIVEKFIRSEGKGGQNVNKVATRVYLKHLPTGIEVKCQKERSQAQNRILARRILADKVERFFLANAQRERCLIEKLRRQRRKRSKAAKERMLEAKRRRSQKKTLRGRVGYEE